MSTAPRRILLAPMEGLIDPPMRAALTRLGGYDACFSEFVRVSATRLPRRTFLRVCPELAHGARTANGTPVWVQLLGGDPGLMAENAATLAALSPPGIDLNFGCPSPTVNSSGGGAVLLDEPGRLHAIARAVRDAMPAALPLTAKMRLGIADTGRAIECAQALADGGVEAITVHARTRDDRYTAPARWEWIARVREAVSVRVIANGDVHAVDDWARCRAATGCDEVMLARGAVADPFLARRLRGEEIADPVSELLPVIREYWRAVQARVEPRHGPGRLKHWFGYLARALPWAAERYPAIRRARTCAEMDAVLVAAGVILERAAG